MPVNSLEGMDEAQIAGYAQIAKTLSSDPATRKDFLRLMKKKDPNLAIPEVDIDERIEAAVKPFREKDEQRDLKELERQTLERIGNSRRALKENGHTDEEIASIEKLMTENHIPSYETASEFYRLRAQSAQPTPPTLTVNTLPVAGKVIKEAGGIAKWARQEAYNAINDIKSGRVKLPAS